MQTARFELINVITSLRNMLLLLEIICNMFFIWKSIWNVITIQKWQQKYHFLSATAGIEPRWLWPNVYISSVLPTVLNRRFKLILIEGKKAYQQFIQRPFNAGHHGFYPKPEIHPISNRLNKNSHRTRCSTMVTVSVTLNTGVDYGFHAMQ